MGGSAACLDPLNPQSWLTMVETRPSQTPDTTVRQFWIAFAALILAFAPTLWDLGVDWWTDSNYSHGFLVPVISGYLIWKKRERLMALMNSPERTVGWAGTATLTIAALWFALGSGAAEYFTARVAFVLAVAGVTMSVCGKGVFRAIWFEIAFLLFMIPIPYVIYYALTTPLQLFATKLSMVALSVVGVPAVQEGNVIHLEGISLEVAEACSGIRSMISLAALGALWAWSVSARPVGKAILFLATVPIAIATNVFRVFMTALLAYASDVAVTEEPTHSIMGMSVFVVAFILFFAFAGVTRGLFSERRPS